MFFKYTNYTLKKFEAIFEELTYQVRYAKGNFKSGYCIVEARNVIVINKFFDTEARINSLLDVLGKIEVDESLLTEKSLDFYTKLKKKVLSQTEEVAETDKEETT